MSDPATPKESRHTDRAELRRRVEERLAGYLATRDAAARAVGVARARLKEIDEADEISEISEGKHETVFRDVVLDRETGRTLRVYRPAQGSIHMRVYYAAEGLLQYDEYGSLSIDVDEADEVAEAIRGSAGLPR